MNWLFPFCIYKLHGRVEIKFWNICSIWTAGILYLLAARIKFLAPEMRRATVNPREDPRRLIKPTSFPGSLLSAWRQGRLERPWKRGCSQKLLNTLGKFFFLVSALPFMKPANLSPDEIIKTREVTEALHLQAADKMAFEMQTTFNSLLVKSLLLPFGLQS